jgi:succinate-semialdehyde dehydrogenase/glutarate-semialdehyde dehydrogenase
VAEAAGKNLKKSLLELGGSNAFIVLRDADLDDIMDAAIFGRIQNNGQSCIAAKRFIVQNEIYDEFKERLVSRFQGLKVGDPNDTRVEIGPLARIDLAKELEEQMEYSLKKGAKLVLGGNRDKALFEPTILENVVPGMPAFDEETFGPLATLTRVDSVFQAIELANKSKFGLGATICSGDTEYAKQLATRIQDGAVFINSMVKSDPRLPFGGTKMSGYGRELGEFGIREFTNVKTYYVA